jgi:ketosteroid isomerase-like protein
MRKSKWPLRKELLGRAYSVKPLNQSTNLRLLGIFAVACTSVAFLPECSAAEDNVSLEKEVLATLDKLSSAGIHRDVAALTQLYSDDYFHTNPDGSVMTREEVLASYKAPTIFHFDSSQASSQRLIVRGTFAVVNQILALHGEKQGVGKFTSRYRVTYVLEKQNAGWKFVNSHSSLLGIEPERHASH